MKLELNRKAESADSMVSVAIVPSWLLDTTGAVGWLDPSGEHAAGRVVRLNRNR